MPVEIDTPTPEQLTDRAWLLGKMQTSLMRDGWTVTGMNPEEGTLEMRDGLMTFTISLTLPTRDKPAAVSVHNPAKKSTPKRKR